VLQDGVTLPGPRRYRSPVSTGHRFSGPLERLAATTVTAVATAAANEPTGSATLDPDTLIRALNFALLGSDSQAFLWESPADCVIVSDTYNADRSCRFTEVLHLSKVDGSSRIDVRQFVEDCVE
jgi:hypothetical protein